MSADRIAELVRQLQQDRFAFPKPNLTLGETDESAMETLLFVAEAAKAMAKHGEIIDASAMVLEVKALTNKLRAEQGNPTATIGITQTLTQGFDVAPPWPAAIVAYDLDDTTGLIAMQAREITDPSEISEGSMWDTDEDEYGNKVTVDWSRVRWIINASLFTDESKLFAPGLGISLFGPAAMWRLAVYEDGQGAYIWTKTTAGPDRGSYAFDLMVLLHTLNICNAANVYLDVPKRSRPMAKRIARTGVRVTEIHIRPSKASGSAKGAVVTPGVPLTTVRGHFAEYGPKYGKGLLFGRIEGRFWIPHYVRGDEAYGVIEHSYDVEP